MDDSELLEYETETETEDEAAVRVCVDEPVVTVPAVPQHATCYTVVVALASDQEYAELLPLDPLRARAMIVVSDHDVVLCHSRGQAQDSRNRITNVPNPSGMLVKAWPPALEITTTAPLWVAATTTTAARVSVLVERRTA